MRLSRQTVTLDADSPDREALLVFRDGRLLAVLSHLSDIHPDLQGQWFVEAMFGNVPPRRPQVFETPDRFEEWLRTSQ